MTSIGVVGAGYWGRNIIRELHKRKCLKFVCELDTSLWTTQTVPVHWSTDLAACLALEVDVVAIATPIHTHFHIALEALRQGKHVFIEKPMAETSEQCQTLLRVAQECSRRIMVGHILHYHAGVQRMFRWLFEHPTEKIEHVVCRRGRYNGETVDKGHLLWDLGPHDVSVVLRLARSSAAVDVGAFGMGAQEGRPQAVYAFLKFANGADVSFEWTNLSTRKISSYTVMTTNYLLVFDDTESQQHDKCKVFRRRQGTEAAVTCESIVVTDPSTPLEQELDTLLLSVDSNEEVYTDGDEGAAVVAILERLQACLNQ